MDVLWHQSLHHEIPGPKAEADVLAFDCLLCRSIDVISIRNDLATASELLLLVLLLLHTDMELQSPERVPFRVCLRYLCRLQGLRNKCCLTRAANPQRDMSRRMKILCKIDESVRSYNGIILKDRISYLRGYHEIPLPLQRLLNNRQNFVASVYSECTSRQKVTNEIIASANV